MDVMGKKSSVEEKLSLSTKIVLLNVTAASVLESKLPLFVKRLLLLPFLGFDLPLSGPERQEMCGVFTKNMVIEVVLIVAHTDYDFHFGFNKD